MLEPLDPFLANEVEYGVRVAALRRRRRPFTPDQVDRAVDLACDLHAVLLAHGVPWWEARDLTTHLEAALDGIRASEARQPVDRKG